MINRKLRGAFKISLIYFLAGCVWIISSDTALGILIPDRGKYAAFQTYKGWVFILISAILLFILLYNELRKRDIIESDLNNNINEKKVLLNEVHHRVKNNLNAIISLLYLENSKAKSSDSKEMIETLTGRIYSMALVHELIYKSENFKGISLKDYIPRLVLSISEAYTSKKDIIKIKYNIDNTVLDLTRAIPLGILMNEVINNSFKHAYPDQREGTISVEFKHEGNRYFLIIADDGTGFDDRNLRYMEVASGLELVKLLVNQLSGEINIVSQTGTKYSINLPAGN